MSQPNDTLVFVPVTQPDQIQSVSDLAGPIWRESFTSIVGPEQVEFMLVDWQSPQAINTQIQEGARYFLAMLQKQAIGYCAWIGNTDGRAKISKFYLCSTHYGKGFAQQMMQFLESEAHHAGMHTLWLQVNRHNHRAIRFYHKSGFRIVRDQYQQVGPGFFIDDHIMEKKITLPEKHAA